MDVGELLGPRGPLSSMPGYELRSAQIEMARAVLQSLDEEGVLLVEAGTGTGKTVAYLLPALLSGRKVVVSTGTKTLQDQIMDHDLPLLQRVLGEPISAACMKGLNNYLCLRRYDEFRRSERALRPAAARDLPLLENWLDRTHSGDRAELLTAFRPERFER